MHDLCKRVSGKGNRERKGEMMHSYVMIYITAKDIEEAENIGKILVKEKLAACANIIPKIKSIYWWKGEIESGEEVVLILKTKGGLIQSVIERVKNIHSYETPCIDVVPVTDGNKDYFEWIEESLK